MRASIWLVSVNYVSGKLSIELKAGPYIVGRSESSQISIKDRTVSKAHARLACQGKTVLVEDLNSLNHTFLNGKEVTSATAEVGDDIQFGAVKCRFSSSPLSTADPEESMSTVQVQQASLPTIDISHLTPAQQEVLALVIQGLNDQEIARRTNRSPATVHTHLRDIFRLLDVHSRAQLIIKATRQ